MPPTRWGISQKNGFSRLCASTARRNGASRRSDLSRKQRRQPRGVLDTSVLVAGVAAFRGAPLEPVTASGKLLLRWIEKSQFQWLYTDDILDEYKAVLLRLGVRRHTVGALINTIRERGTRVVARRGTQVSPDPGDEPFCVCAESGDADFIVTLNLRDFPQQKLRATVITPDQPIPAWKGRTRRQS